MKRVLIGGIGNVLLGDDGVGPYVARLLAASYVFDDDVEVIDLGTPALDLIDQISGKDAVILIDCIVSEASPGTIMLYRKADIICHAPTVRMDPHSPALVDTLLGADFFGMAPAELLLVGIIGASHDSGCGLSAPVHASLDHAIAEVLNELDRLGIKYRRREQLADSGIWWTQTQAESPTIP
jgi:hydrogenase maturation protease